MVGRVDTVSQGVQHYVSRSQAVFVFRSQAVCLALFVMSIAIHLNVCLIYGSVSTPAGDFCAALPPYIPVAQVTIPLLPCSHGGGQGIMPSIRLFNSPVALQSTIIILFILVLVLFIR